MRRKRNAGFILPLSVVLVMLLGISGLSFMQLDWLERRVTLNEVDNHGAFYLAQTGIARAQDLLKIDTQSVPNWTTVLAGLTPDPNRAGNSLCPSSLTLKCGIIPSIGATVVSPDNLAFVTTLFDTGSYEIRAFNDAESEVAGDTDYNGFITVRARGTIRGEHKVLESTIQAVSTVNLINCVTGDCPSQPCNDTTTPRCLAADGREPAVGPVPTPTFPLADTRNYYREPHNFPNFITNGNSTTNYSGTLSDSTYYNLTGDVTLTNVTGNSVVVFTTGKLTVKTNANLTNAILIGAGGVEFQGSSAISAPPTLQTGRQYPAVISGGNITSSSGDITGSGGGPTISGNVYAQGAVNLNSVDVVHGAVFGNQVTLQGTGTYTDDHGTDSNYFKKYYAPMPGFTYAPEMLTTVTVTGTWREIE